MKTTAAIVVPLLILFLAFLYFHDASIDRAQLINSANELLVAHEQLQKNGSLVNRSRVHAFTNRVTVGGIEFQCELMADVPSLSGVGSLVATTNATLIWIDKKTGPTIVRGSDHQIVIPRRFHDF